MDKKNIIISAIIAVAVISLTILLIPKSNIDLAVKYISNNTLPDGQFVYKNNLDSSVKYDTKIYNEERHAEVLYSMYLLEKYKKSNSLKAQRKLASDYFVNNYIHAYNGMQMVYQKQPIMSEVADIGSAGSALIALSNLCNQNPSYLPLLEGVGKFLVFMQKPDGSFYHAIKLKNYKFEPVAYGISYPGKAALGLLYLNDYAEDKLWVLTAKKALIYIAKARCVMGKDIPMEPWSILAVKKLFETKNNTLTDKERLILQKYVEQMAKSTIRRQITQTSDKYYGSFDGDTKFVDIASNIEGLIGAYYCTDNPTLQKRIKNSIDLGLKFLSQNQIKRGKYAGGIPFDIRWRRANTDQQTMIRIDVVEHALSAWITSEAIK